ncbi:ABC transporter ATP-binding protein [Bifidobacterium actinocoloniiforme DSM 22766]|uniref:ABC transporter ATP-binding protein n=1 Tax=Bifidobacterium actinocoloniiforme DSM 22766 TaxID=1437605 RepID=A0A086Z1A5_9BIFI|nr:ABC transporter ATP-binding protein [Bifidobacterium actinocoloniiforme]AKV55465.1 ABC transporter [Bifidobacterium actinocoloniiforme DSM 22766]KFI40305.1 ABC transporter ATP-binding protein [Bifidobacterium actinocoloniiforme DSM 22766]
MTQTALDIHDVGKKFGRFTALDHVSLSVRRGDVYGLIGENGAGKTTLMRLICGLSPMQSGSISLFGESGGASRRALSRIGAVIESPAAFSSLTVDENLKVAAIQHGLPGSADINEAIEFVGLGEKRRTKAKHLSLGQRQRLGLAMAILHHPDFLILDEPINGLDPSGIMEFRRLLQRLNEERQTTILISSHILSELYQVSTRFGIIHKGRMVKEISRSELDEANQAGLLVSVDKAPLAARILDTAGIGPFEVSDDHHLFIRSDGADPGRINLMLVQGGVMVEGFSRREGSLEQYYLNLLAKQRQADKEGAQ